MTSPDKKVDAVIVEENCGATMPFVDLIYIVPCGDSIKNHSPIYKSTYTRELEVKWAESKRLIISYKNANIHEFKSEWVSDDIDDTKYKVKITKIKPEGQ